MSEDELYEKLFNAMMEHVPLSRDQRDFLSDDNCFSNTEMSNIISFKWDSLRRREQLEILNDLGELHED